MKNVYLIGLMGSGKTTLGRILAQRVHRKHVDTDDLIETYFSMAIPQVFAEKGEDAFRDGETEVLCRLSKQRNRIVSTGGGIVLREENITLMRNSGTVIWIKRDPKRILQSPRIRKRPLLANDVNAIYSIWEQRQPLYKKACHFVVYNDGDRENTVQELLKILR